MTSPTVRASCGEVFGKIEAAGIRTRVYANINTEPTVRMFEECLAVARREPLDGVIGLGGGSPLDVAKLVAALAGGTQTVPEIFGNPRNSVRPGDGLCQNGHMHRLPAFLTRRQSQSVGCRVV